MAFSSLFIQTWTIWHICASKNPHSKTGVFDTAGRAENLPTESLWCIHVFCGLSRDLNPLRTILWIAQKWGCCAQYIRGRCDKQQTACWLAPAPSDLLAAWFAVSLTCRHLFLGSLHSLAMLDFPCGPQKYGDSAPRVPPSGGYEYTSRQTGYERDRWDKRYCHA